MATPLQGQLLPRLRPQKGSAQAGPTPDLPTSQPSPRAPPPPRPVTILAHFHHLLLVGLRPEVPSQLGHLQVVVDLVHELLQHVPKRVLGEKS